MRKTLIAIIAVAALMVSMASVALAQNPHFVGQVRFTDLGTTLNVTGSIAGLGNQNIDVEVIASGTASITCTNPGGNVAPGQSKTITAIGTVANLEPKNGRVNFNVTTEEPVAPSNACPNAQWTPTIVDVVFTSVTVNVYQPAGSGNLVLSQAFTP